MNTHHIPESLGWKYHGCGYAIAAITPAGVQQFTYISDISPTDDYNYLATAYAIAVGPSADADRARLAKLGELKFGMLSAMEFCELEDLEP